MHGVHHGVQGRVQNGLGLFRVEVADQFGRALEVGKQDRDLLTLAFEGAFEVRIFCQIGRAGQAPGQGYRPE